MKSNKSILCIVLCFFIILQTYSFAEPIASKPSPSNTFVAKMNMDATTNTDLNVEQNQDNPTEPSTVEETNDEEDQISNPPAETIPVVPTKEELKQERIKTANQPKIVEMDKKYLTFEEVEGYLKKIQERYKEIVTLQSLGKSHDNRDIYLVKLGKGDTKILLEAGLHAREYVNIPVVVNMIEEYSKAYYRGEKFGEYDVEDMLNKVTMYIVPMSNPDGTTIAVHGKNKIRDEKLRKLITGIKDSAYEWKANARGVDLNRNFPSKEWSLMDQRVSRGSLRYLYRTKPASIYYGGTTPNSENETKILTKLMDQNNFYGAISYHSRGQVIYWHKPLESSLMNKILENVANKLIHTTKYMKIQPSSFSGFAGYITDYLVGKYDKPIVTIETTPAGTALPIPLKTIKKVWEDIKYTPFVLATQALNTKNSYLYKVYQNDVLLKDFLSKDKAIAYAKLYSNTKIVDKDNKVVWKFIK